jgi:hypothetical protein
MGRFARVGYLSLVASALAACGSATPVNFYDSTDTSAATGGSPGAGGTPAMGRGGNNGGPGPGGSDPGATCGPVQDTTGANDTLNTTGPACLRVAAPLMGWGCSNFDGRTVKVNGESLACAAPLPAAIDGVYYFDISAGMFAYAELYWF